MRGLTITPDQLSELKYAADLIISNRIEDVGRCDTPGFEECACSECAAEFILATLEEVTG